MTNPLTSTPTNAQEGVESLFCVNVAPGLVMRGCGAIKGEAIARLGRRPLVVAGNHTLSLAEQWLKPALQAKNLAAQFVSYSPDSCEESLANLKAGVSNHEADLVIGFGGGKALDIAKLVAYRCGVPVVTIPTSAATCAAWSGLSNVYSPAGAFLYDVALAGCPELLILDYDLIATASSRTLVAGIGDALAKWYEASVSSGQSQDTLVIAAVQQARVLRDILFQKSVEALKNPGSQVWREVVDASVLLAGVVGGIGGARCRTVAAHAVHNGLTHILASHGTLHGEKVAFGILVQLRLEEMLAGNQLAATARQQLLKFYSEINLPCCLSDLGLGNITLAELGQAAEIACAEGSDIHRLPFKVVPEQLMAAMVSTKAPVESGRGSFASAVFEDAVEV